jgi:hypothetical protein
MGGTKCSICMSEPASCLPSERRRGASSFIGLGKGGPGRERAGVRVGNPSVGMFWCTHGHIADFLLREGEMEGGASRNEDSRIKELGEA